MSRCIVCSDSGWRYLPGPLRQVTRCECRTLSLEAKLIGAGVPPRYAHARLSQFSEATLRPVTQFRQTGEDGILVLGPSGTGKTHFSIGLISAEIECGHRALFRRCSDVCMEVRATFISGSETTENQVLSKYFHSSLLVVDDVGSSSLSDFERRFVLDLLDRRWSFKRGTVVTSNLSLAEIAEWDDRIASRLRAFTPIILGGPDRRAKSS